MALPANLRKKTEMRQIKIISGFLSVFSLLLATCSALSPIPFFQKVSLTPGFYHRSPGSVGFRLFEETQSIESGSILTVRSSFIAPLATETRVVCGSHTISFFPGATVKILADGLQPLSGRIEIISEEALEPLILRAGKFYGEVSDGHLLLEVTPDNGTYIAMRNTGKAWFKDHARKIYELENGRELHFPLFGPTVEMPVLSGFWSDQPSSFFSARKKAVGTTFSPNQNVGEVLEIASDTEAADGSGQSSDNVASDSEELIETAETEKRALPETENAPEPVPADSIP